MKLYIKISITILLLVLVVYLNGFAMNLLNMAIDGANIGGIILILFANGIGYFGLNKVWNLNQLIKGVKSEKD